MLVLCYVARAGNTVTHMQYNVMSQAVNCDTNDSHKQSVVTLEEGKAHGFFWSHMADTYDA